MSSPNASWSEQDENDLLDYLIDHKAQAGDGGSFKLSPTFTGASAVLDPKKAEGTGPKTAKSCQTKWDARVHKAINVIQDRSGWTWDGEKGANIQPDHAQAWEEFLKHNPRAKPFHNKGWIYLSKMDQLVPHIVHGAHVFSATQGTVGLGSQPTDPVVPTASSDTNPPDSSLSFNSPPPTFDSLGLDVNDHEDVSGAFTDSPATLSRPESSGRSAATASEEAQAIRKRERAQTVTPSVSASKKTKLSGPEAIQNLNQTFSKFGEDICAAISLDPLLRTPARRKEALKKLQQEVWLPTSDRLLLYNHFESDSKALNAYSALEDTADAEFRKAWIQARLEMLKDQARSLF
ncbi:hypothetical protein EST38_g14333 [Candolleomyces aberdarensis]|uniref:Myb/SANT-like domain-containing protein n=1 Tax=Candolleomyces aberdarensis TaxID=2316362 RepID=A0A4Q2CZY6_9AGAR|nr:hypothetical protein EST38_g14333 [Candolleomyces aberdarensis]